MKKNFQQTLMGLRRTERSLEKKVQGQLIRADTQKKLTLINRKSKKALENLQLRNIFAQVWIKKQR